MNAQQSRYFLLTEQGRCESAASSYGGKARTVVLMAELSIREELIQAGLAIVRERGLTGVLPDFTVRELIERGDGPTRSAFQHAWPQRVDFERAVFEEVLAERAQHPPASITSVPRALDLMESGPNLAQFTRAVYANASGLPRRNDLRERIAVTCASGASSDFAEFAAQAETARYAQADMQFVQILRIAGMAFGFEPAEGFTFLDVAKIVGATTDGMLLQRIVDDSTMFDDHVWDATPGWPLESILTSAAVALLTVPIGDAHTVPTDRKMHPSDASRPVASVPPPRRPPTTRSVLLDAGVGIVNERGLRCALPQFTVAELIQRVSPAVTEGAFHHNWARKADFELEIMRQLVSPDVARLESTQLDLTSLAPSTDLSRSAAVYTAAEQSMNRSADLSFMFVCSLAAADGADPTITAALSDCFGARISTVTAALAGVGTRFNLVPKQPMTWELITRMALAVTDGVILRAMVDPRANETSLDHPDAKVPVTLLGLAYDAVVTALTEPGGC